MSALESHVSKNASCPWSGNPVRADSLTRYRGHVVGFCNPGCRDKFERALACFDRLIDGEATMAEYPENL